HSRRPSHDLPSFPTRRSSDLDRAAEIEPALAPVKDKIAGAVYSPIDQTGDSRQFTERLAAWASDRLGVVFRLGTTVDGLDIEGDRVTAVRTSTGAIAGDAVVLSLGPESGLFGRRYGIDLPVYPVKGYAATIPLDDPARGPTMG